jgi:tetratricopeptide (TPR) repeat protein
VWSSYSSRQAAQLIGLSESAVRSCIRDGLIGFTDEVPAQLTFRDLATLRLVKKLSDDGVPLASVRRQLLLLHKGLEANQSITELAIEARGNRIAIKGQLIERGQLELPWSNPTTTASGQVGASDNHPNANTNVEPRGQLHVLTAKHDAKAAPESAQPSSAIRMPVPTLAPIALTTADEWFLRGTQLEEADPLAAAEAYRRGLRLRPDAAEFWINLGRLLAENRDSDGASQCFLAAAELDPRDATVHYNLGVVAQDDGRENEAIDRYRRAIDLDPALAEAHYNLATLFDQSGDARAAIRHINEYRKLTKGR